MSPKNAKKIDLKDEIILNLPLTSPVSVGPDDTLGEVTKIMQRYGRGSVLVEYEGDLMGIFTERDVLTKILGTKVDDKSPIKDHMTRKPHRLKITDSVLDAVTLMVGHGIRHIPIWDSAEGTHKVISVRDVIDYLAELFPKEVLNLPPDFDQGAHRQEGG